MLEFEIYYNNQLLPKIVGNGVLVSTPTGSTSYSLSLGGPLVNYQFDAFILSFDAPFIMSIRPLILPKGDEITIFLSGNGNSKECFLVNDGNLETDFTSEYGIQIKSSDFYVEFILL